MWTTLLLPLSWKRIVAYGGEMKRKLVELNAKEEEKPHGVQC